MICFHKFTCIFQHRTFARVALIVNGHGKLQAFVTAKQITLIRQAAATAKAAERPETAS
jgi:hypothetical protein